MHLLTYSMIPLAIILPNLVLGIPTIDEVRDATLKLEARQTPSVNGRQYWANDFADGDFEYEQGDDGQFSLEWDMGFGANFVIGRGYSPAREMLLNYSGSFEVDERAYLALYGWTQNPLTEYYVIESMGIHNPSDNENATWFGNFETDGGTYEVWSKWRVNEPSIIGDATYRQYWSIRTKRHVGGTINTANHFDAFERAGLTLGRQLSMNIVIEGQQGAGSADITVGTPPKTSVRESPTPTRRTELPRTRTADCTLRPSKTCPSVYGEDEDEE